MSLVLSMVGGKGGSAEVFAFIVATYPSGSVCTCSDGTTTLTAEDTSGLWVFDIPYAGVWTVKATDALHPDGITSEVTITDKGESHSINLEYSYYIYQNGNVRSGITNSQYTKSGTVTYGESVISLHTNSNANSSVTAFFYPVDITRFSKISAYCYNDNTNDVWFDVYIAPSGSVTPFDSSVIATTHYHNEVGKSGNALELDVSSYSGIVYVGVSMNTNNASWGSARNGYCEWVLIE